MSLVLQRQSIRKYKDKPVEQSKIKQLLKAGMQAPSANNQQPWEFIVVDDRALLDNLSETSSGAWMLKDAAVAIIPLIMTGDRSPKFAIQDLSAATENILLEATNQSLGAVWIGCYPKEERYKFVEEVLNIKKGHPFSMIAVGYPDEEKEMKLRYDEKRVHFNKQ
ncbi:MAG: nitroreductase family protein [Candidatus Izimaplasma sp.]|nr:nitroreductase family protein [Candidatus Izimaplasma bacterium]